MKYWIACSCLLLPHPARAQDPVAAPAAPAAFERGVRLGLSSVSAVGVTHAGFFNQLLGARLEYRFTRRFAFGGALHYANLKGKDGRVHNVLPEATLEHRVPLRAEKLGAPLRLGLGYLRMNGPTLRLGAGLDFPLSEALSVELVPLEPMIWVSRERPEVSLNGSLALRWLL